MLWVLTAFIEPACHAWANILDSYLANKLFNRLTPLIFISSALGLLVVPIIWIFDPPSLISLNVVLILFVASIIDFSYLYLYYLALRHTDTSVVTSLFSLGLIFLPILAFFLIGEKLALSQYFGFFIITIASIALTFDVKKIKINPAFFLMIFVAVILSAQSVLLKYAYQHGVGWGTSIIWLTLFRFFTSGALVLFPKNHPEIRGSIQKIKSAWKIFVGMEALSWAGNLGYSYTLYLIPLSIARGIASTQPIFVLIYALIFAKIWPNIFHEYLTKSSVAKKVILFLLTITGIFLVIGI